MTTEVNILFSHIYHLCALIQPVNLIIFFYISFMKQRIIELETEVRLLRAEIKAVKDEKDRDIKAVKDEKDRDIKAVKDEKDRDIKAVKDEKDRAIKAVKDEKDRVIKVLQDENKSLLVENAKIKNDMVRSLYNYTRLFLHLSDD